MLGGEVPTYPLSDTVDAEVPMSRSMHLAQLPEANELLAGDPFSLLTGMLLDQQIPMERAFSGPYVLAQRLGDPTRLDPCRISSMPSEDLVAAAAGPPAVHRFPKAMAERIAALAEIVCTRYGGDAADVWTEAADGPDCLRRLKALPGFGDQKARIFIALLGKQWGVDLAGWREASTPYGDQGTFLSVADVVDGESLARVRAFKKERKAAARV